MEEGWSGYDLYISRSTCVFNALVVGIGVPNSSLEHYGLMLWYLRLADEGSRCM